MSDTVTIEKGASAPSDISLIPKSLRPSGTWWLFSTDQAHAYVFTSSGQGVVPAAFLLHWIESAERGHGSALMLAIGAWADHNELWGSLICTVEMTTWYHRFGWNHLSLKAFDAVCMERPIGAQPRKES